MCNTRSVRDKKHTTGFLVRYSLRLFPFFVGFTLSKSPFVNQVMMRRISFADELLCLLS